jgi:hypothetical protein
VVVAAVPEPEVEAGSVEVLSVEVLVDDVGVGSEAVRRCELEPEDGVLAAAAPAPVVLAGVVLALVELAGVVLEVLAGVVPVAAGAVDASGAVGIGGAGGAVSLTTGAWASALPSARTAPIPCAACLLDAGGAVVAYELVTTGIRRVVRRTLTILRTIRWPVSTRRVPGIVVAPGAADARAALGAASLGGA